MTWSIRARLTAWYSIVVVVVLISATLVVDVRQERLMLQGLDDELGRQMATLQGVLRTEFGEGLDLQAAADEASVEVLAPGRTLVLMRPEGALLARWGGPIDPQWRPSKGAVLETATIGAARVRVRSEPVQFERHRYIAAVIAPLAELDAADVELRRTLGLGTLVALIVAAAGGWLVGRQTLRPLEAMASQAMAIEESTAGDRLQAPHPDDELGRFASAFNGLLDRLVHALQAQRQFMADASHELRTPVSVVRTTAQVALARDTRTPEDYREMMTVVGEQSERLSRLVDAMFLLSRAEAHGLPLQPEALYVDDLVSESARALQVLARDRDVSVTANGDSEVRFVGDDRLLRQMVTNLLDNAVRHAPRSGAVSATVLQTPTTIAIRVTDNGTGVPAEARERIFQRFTRLNQEYAGAGLGLPIARWVAEAHGGALVLESSGPGGSTFTVTIPRAV
jgi:signal transduction histidine kinase